MTPWLLLLFLPPLAAQADTNSLAIDLGSGVAMDFALIPAGDYSMGSLTGDADEQPVRVFTFSHPFWLGKCEVTQAQYQRVIGTNPSTFQDPRRPVESVTYQDVTDFLVKMQQLQVAPAGYMPRLPTESEWEYACRAGTTGDYSCGTASNLGAAAWYADDGGDSTHAVGEKKPNAYGLYDMHGNVWEWCNDWYSESYYRSGLADVDAAGPHSGASRVLRGGSWRNSAPYCRSSNRFRYRPWVKDYTVGFRVALVPQ